MFAKFNSFWFHINCPNTMQNNLSFMIINIQKQFKFWQACLFLTVCVLHILASSTVKQAWAKVDFLVTKTDQTIFLGLFSDQTNTNI